MTQEDKKSLIVIIVSFAIAVMLSPLFIQCAKSQNEKAMAEYESRVYLIEIIDKYDHLGSSWHLIGGRATEQEYHIIYKATPLTEEAKKLLAIEATVYGDGEPFQYQSEVTF